ncbi:TraB/GumN family protein [Chitinophaga sp. sic0106]|uniref:TraB/GumN family protein n=1 Tax=Chitinophaga sp. sic0106 TaxID=2854785 RepID=UPI001C492216|nr:TraB/GumN family protein [Chitinophaga sp. sic0106]MBV7531827.1 TraB/GumN family protein [Chitinophaga sp. sic0106]
MKKIILVCLTVICLFTLQTNAQSVLWKVSGNGLEKPSYLFGTIHMICAGDFEIKPKVKAALEAADAYVIETDIHSPEARKVMQAAAISQEPQSKRLSAATYKEVDSILMKHLKIPFQKLDNYTLGTINSILVMGTYKCTDLKQYETELRKLAMEKQIKMDTLESVTAQMEFFNKTYNDDYTIAQMRAFDDYSQVLTSMITNYKAENFKQLYAEMTAEKFMDKNSKHWLLHVRNANWAKKMPAMMQKGSNFFAVGTAHLGGEDGLIKLLQNQGYTVEPILN